MPPILFVPVAPTFRFDGSQKLVADFTHESATLAEELTLTFRTSRPFGVVFSTHNDKQDSRLVVYMSAAKLLVKYVFNSFTEVSHSRFLNKQASP